MEFSVDFSDDQQPLVLQSASTALSSSSVLPQPSSGENRTHSTKKRHPLLRALLRFAAGRGRLSRTSTGGNSLAATDVRHASSSSSSTDSDSDESIMGGGGGIVSDGGSGPSEQRTLNGKRTVVREGIAREWRLRAKRRHKVFQRQMMRYARYPQWRRRLFQVVESDTFERGVYFMLACNCLLLSTQNIQSLTAYQGAVEMMDAVFTFAFVIEMVLKMIALGIFVPSGYFSRYWNWVDGSITLLSAAGLIAFYATSATNAVVALRSFRLIRPLRMMTSLSSLRALLDALAASLSRLGNVAILTGAFLTLMALIALAFFRYVFNNACQSMTLSDSGLLYATSVVNTTTNATSSSNWLNMSITSTANASMCALSGNATWWWLDNISYIDPTQAQLVSTTLQAAEGAGTVLNPKALPQNSVGMICPYEQYCLPAGSAAPDNGYSNFNTIFNSAVLLYTILSLEGWSSIMFYVMDVLGNWVSLYFVTNVIVGTIFVLNLVLATVSDGFNRSIKYQAKAEVVTISGGSSSPARPSTANARHTNDNTTTSSSGGEDTSQGWSGMFIPAALSIMSLPQGTLRDRLLVIQENVRLHVLYHPLYQLLRQGLTVCSVVTLATTYAGMSDTHRNAVKDITTICTIIFALENILEVIGLGKRFFKDPVRVMDALVSIGAVAEAALQSRPSVAALRAVRFLELMMRFPALRQQIRVLKVVIVDTLPLIMFMGILLYLASLIGVQLFAQKFCGLDPTSSTRVKTSMCPNNDVPRLNFDNVGYSVVSVFVIFCGDGWRAMIANGMQTVGDYSAIYFCLCYLLGGYLMFNLFVAIMISSAERVEDEPQQNIVNTPDNVRLSVFDPVSVVSGVYSPTSRSGGGDDEGDDGDLVQQDSMLVEVDNNSVYSHAGGIGSFSQPPSRLRGNEEEGEEEKEMQMQREGSIVMGEDQRYSASSPTVETIMSPVDQEEPLKAHELPRRRMSILKSSFSGINDSSASGGVNQQQQRPRGRSVRFQMAEEEEERLAKASSFSFSSPPVDLRPDISSAEGMLNLSSGLLDLESILNKDDTAGDNSAAERLLFGPFDKSSSDAEDLTVTKRAEQLLADEVEYDIINRGAVPLPTVREAQKQAQRDLARHINQLPWIRRVAGSIVKSKRFEYGYIVVVLYSMATVMATRATDYPDSTANTFRNFSDFAVALLFLVEFALKTTHHGIFHAKRTLLKGYFNYRWNIFDFVIMLFSLLAACAVFTTNRTFEHIADWCRIARVLRPFSLIGRHEGLKVVSRATIASLPRIRNVGMIAIGVWVTFSIVGTNLFSGKFGACTQTDWGDMSYVTGNITSRVDCLAQGYLWTSPKRNFDTFWSSLLATFQLATVDNWTDIMFTGVDSFSEDYAPYQRSRMYLFPFFVVFILLTTFFLIQFFVASMCEVYFEVKLQMEESVRNRLLRRHELFLDQEQKAYVGMYRRALFFVKPPLHIAVDLDSYRMKLRKIVRHWMFEPGFTVVAIVHIVLESLYFAANPPFSIRSLLTIDWVFNGVFVLIALITWYTYGTRNFLGSSRGRWSILINVLTTTGLILAEVGATDGAATLLRHMRVFRLVRIFYLTDTMQLLVDTISYSLPSFMNVFFLLFLVFFLYAAIGMQLFGRVHFSSVRSGVNRYANFDRFDKAFIALLRVATFDDWTELMYSCAVQPPDCDESIGECPPHPAVSYLFFLSFALVGQWIGINFFSAEVMDAFSHAEMEERYAVQQSHVIAFQRLWKAIAGSSENLMSIPQLVEFMSRLGPPLGPVFNDRNRVHTALKGVSVGDGASSSSVSALKLRRRLAAKPTYNEVLRFIVQLRIPVILGNYVMQGSVFDGLMRHFYSTPLPITYQQSIHQVVSSRFQMRQYLRKVRDTLVPSEVSQIVSAVAFRPDFEEDEAETGGRSQHPYWVAYHNAKKSLPSVEDDEAHLPPSIQAVVAVIRLQSWWRGMRVRELVRMAKEGQSYVPRHAVRHHYRRSKAAVGAEQQEQPALRRQRSRASSIATYERRRVLRSIAERLKENHSDLI